MPRDDVPEVVAETFLHAWRRWDDVPQPALPWLLVAARNVIANRRRTARRQRALADRVALLGSVAAGGVDAGVLADERAEALTALASLPEQQREALLLVAWDGLTPAQAARVLGIKPGALRVRIHRARAALSSITRISETTNEPQRSTP